MSRYNIKVGDVYVLGSTQSLGAPPGDPTKSYLMMAVVAPKEGHYPSLEVAQDCAVRLRRLLHTSASNVRVVPAPRKR